MSKEENGYSFKGEVSLEITDIPAPLSPEIKQIKRLDVLVKKFLASKTRTINRRVVSLPSPMVDPSNSGIIYVIEASGIPIGVPGGGDHSMGNMWRQMKESVQRAGRAGSF